MSSTLSNHRVNVSLGQLSPTNHNSATSERSTIQPHVNTPTSISHIGGNMPAAGQKMGSRRIFTPQFKLQVLDSYRTDTDCKGNQRATARKYGIHRRQIQKWLQCEVNLRSSVLNSNSTATTSCQSTRSTACLKSGQRFHQYNQSVVSTAAATIQTIASCTNYCSMSDESLQLNNNLMIKVKHPSTLLKSDLNSVTQTVSLATSRHSVVATLTTTPPTITPTHTTNCMARDDNQLQNTVPILHSNGIMFVASSPSSLIPYNYYQEQQQHHSQYESVRTISPNRTASSLNYTTIPAPVSFTHLSSTVSLPNSPSLQSSTSGTLMAIQSHADELVVSPLLLPTQSTSDVNRTVATPTTIQPTATLTENVDILNLSSNDCKYEQTDRNVVTSNDQPTNSQYQQFEDDHSYNRCQEMIGSPIDLSTTHRIDPSMITKSKYNYFWHRQCENRMIDQRNATYDVKIVKFETENFKSANIYDTQPWDLSSRKRNYDQLDQFGKVDPIEQPPPPKKLFKPYLLESDSDTDDSDIRSRTKNSMISDNTDPIIWNLHRPIPSPQNSDDFQSRPSSSIDHPDDPNRTYHHLETFHKYEMMQSPDARFQSTPIISAAPNHYTNHISIGSPVSGYDSATSSCLSDCGDYPNTHHTYKINELSSLSPVSSVYSLDLKLSAIDCYYYDHQCRGNQLAVAQKYHIDREQVERWLQQDDAHRHHYQSMQHFEVDDDCRYYSNGIVA